MLLGRTCGKRGRAGIDGHSECLQVVQAAHALARAHRHVEGTRITYDVEKARRCSANIPPNVSSPCQECFVRGVSPPPVARGRFIVTPFHRYTVTSASLHRHAAATYVMKTLDLATQLLPTVNRIERIAERRSSAPQLRAVAARPRRGPPSRAALASAPRMH